MPLHTYAKTKQPPMRECLELFRRICEAINYAHQRGVIHRDLKSSNILIDADGAPKILDFGLAKITDADVAVTTVEPEIGKIQGTLSYMSPEQAWGNPDEIELRSDVYSLGVILYELMTGQLPYDVDRAMLHEAVRVICEEPPRRPSTISRAGGAIRSRLPGLIEVAKRYLMYVAGRNLGVIMRAIFVMVNCATTSRSRKPRSARAAHAPTSSA